jgi:hypothetical protein
MEAVANPERELKVDILLLYAKNPEVVEVIVILEIVLFSNSLALHAFAVMLILMKVLLKYLAFAPIC